MRKKEKLINIFSWICVLVFLVANYLFMLPIVGCLMFFGFAMSSTNITTSVICFIYLFYLIVSEILTIIPTALFLILDKKIFIRNIKYLSIINILICMLYAIEWYR